MGHHHYNLTPVPEMNDCGLGLYVIMKTKLTSADENSLRICFLSCLLLSLLLPLLLSLSPLSDLMRKILLVSHMQNFYFCIGHFSTYCLLPKNHEYLLSTSFPITHYQYCSERQCISLALPLLPAVSGLNEWTGAFALCQHIQHDSG
jgi:hypothetical protein